MNKEYILRKNEEILTVIKTGTKKVYNHFIIYRKKNQLTHNRYCISISKKLGHAVVRNRLKRQVKDILMKNNICTNEDYVIILSSSFKELTFLDKKSEILKGLE